MIQCICKAIIYEDFEDVYGPCGCGITLATLPVLLPRDWVVLERPLQAECDDFCKGLDYRRISGMSCSNIFEHEMEGVEYMANFSCCRECAEKAVAQGYAVWSKKSYPMALR
ncbi:MAG: hypothetical protein STSR0001_00350 [Methanothrix sp.]|jgi:hypothetical protein